MEMENNMKKKVVVTGAAGYIGRHVVKYLLNQGHEVIAVDLAHKGLDERATYSNVNIFSGDKDIYEQLGSPDVCIHMAWKDGFIHNSKEHMENISDHVRFLYHMIDGGCKDISVMGSMHEVGYWEGMITADTPCNPLSQYGIAKNCLRQSLMLYAKDKDVHIHWLRAFYILGDDYKNASIFTKLLQAAEEGKKEFPFTSGKNQYDFIMVQELAAQIAEASIQEKYDGIINVCSGKPMLLGDRVEQFIKDNHLDIKLNYGAFPDRPYDSPCVYGDNTVIAQIMAMK